MSFYTTLSFYRPDRPPRLTGEDLASFVSAFAALGLADERRSLNLDSWSLEIGPITSHDLGGEVVYMVGWIAVGMHGYGYLYPWTLCDLIERAEACAPVHALMDLCRRTWPVAAKKPPRQVIKARQKMGELWPYPDTDRCWDWCWGLRESG